jgi:glycosyltransferase involved in cell wall biosynthesis
MPNLLLCMTPGVGLNTWKGIGSLERELKPYVEYVKRGFNVRILTFDREDMPALPAGIEAVRFVGRRRLILLPLLMREVGAWADIIKTNQSVNAFYYIRAAKKWGKPIILRCGYVQGEYLETTKGLTPKVRLYQRLEAWAFRNATSSFVPTKALSEWVQERYCVSKDNITIIPNFIDTDVFRPIKGIAKRQRSIISVGRLSPVKRFDLLIKACAGISGCSLTIVGEGPERENLKKLAQGLGLGLTLTGNVANERLPHLLQGHSAFAMTSLREGHPKALIEAMACAMPCVAVKAIGTEDLIEHLKTGVFVGADEIDVRKGIRLVLDDDNLRHKISENASGYARSRFGFRDIFEREIGIAEAVIKGD